MKRVIIYSIYETIILFLCLIIQDKIILHIYKG